MLFGCMNLLYEIKWLSHAACTAIKYLVSEGCGKS